MVKKPRSVNQLIAVLAGEYLKVDFDHGVVMLDERFLEWNNGTIKDWKESGYFSN